VRQPTRNQVAAFADRMGGAWRARHRDVRERTEPERIAGELSADARRRGP
jgi:hypothetical protein